MRSGALGHALVCRLALALGFLLAFGAMGCATYHDQLVRSQAAFEKEESRVALPLLVDLEPHQERLDEIGRARYAYMRGMTDYRLGYRADARHWLAVARAREETTPGVLPADWKANGAKVLAELDEVVFEDGYGALAETKPPAR